MKTRVVRRAFIAVGISTAALLGSAGVAAATPVQPTISSVTFSGTAGSGQPSPTITITGAHFGAAPAGASDDSTSCGAYPANGDVFGSKLYFLDDQNFEAGYSNAHGGTCVGIIIDSWSARRVVLSFGDAYGTFAQWYLSNGDGFALSLKGGIWGGTVTGLS